MKQIATYVFMVFFCLKIYEGLREIPFIRMISLNEQLQQIALSLMKLELNYAFHGVFSIEKFLGNLIKFDFSPAELTEQVVSELTEDFRTLLSDAPYFVDGILPRLPCRVFLRMMVLNYKKILKFHIRK